MPVNLDRNVPIENSSLATLAILIRNISVPQKLCPDCSVLILQRKAGYNKKFAQVFGRYPLQSRLIKNC